MAYEVSHSELVFEGKVFRVRIDQVLVPDGNSMRVDMVEHEGTVAMVPLDEQERIWFVRQYRHPAGEALLELPAGTLEPGEDPELCAIRECREEIGMQPEQLEMLGGVYLAPGYSTEYIRFYLARELHPAPLAPDEDEAISIERLSLDEVLKKLRDGEFKDAKSVTGLYLAFARLGKLEFKGGN